MMTKQVEQIDLVILHCSQQIVQLNDIGLFHRCYTDASKKVFKLNFPNQHKFAQLTAAT